MKLQQIPVWSFSAGMLGACIGGGSTYAMGFPFLAVGAALLSACVTGVAVGVLTRGRQQ